MSCTPSIEKWNFVHLPVAVILWYARLSVWYCWDVDTVSFLMVAPRKPPDSHKEVSFCLYASQVVFSRYSAQLLFHMIRWYQLRLIYYPIFSCWLKYSQLTCWGSSMSNRNKYVKYSLHPSKLMVLMFLINHQSHIDKKYLILNNIWYCHQLRKTLCLFMDQMHKEQIDPYLYR